MIILFDMDGTIADFETAFYNEFCRRHPQLTVIEPAKRTTFKLPDQYPLEYREHIEAIQNEAGFFAGLEPIKGAFEAMQLTLDSGHDAYLCTAPLTNAPYCTYEKQLWVRRYLGEDWFRRLIVTKDKTLVRGDWLVDDKPDISGILKPSWSQIMFDQPYNQDFVGLRLHYWRDWPRLLEQLS